VAAARDPRLTKIGATRYNQPVRTPKHPTKSHAVVAKVKDQTKLIRYGQQGVKGSPYRRGETADQAERRANWKARHAANIAKGPMSAAYWANKSKW
jgi:hypothetical protein